MKLPLRLVPNGLGELADLKDADDRYVAHCVEPEDARKLLAFANGRESLQEEARAARAEAENMRAFLGRFRQTTAWHDERERFVRRAQATASPVED